MDYKMEIKKDPRCLGTLTEMQSDCEDPLESDTVNVDNRIQIKEEPVALKCEETMMLPQTVSCNSMESENSFSYDEDHRTDIKMEIKEEPFWLGSSSNDIGTERKKPESDTEEILGLVSTVQQTSRLCSESHIITSATRDKNNDLKLGYSGPEIRYPEPCTEVTKTKNTAALDVKSSSSIHSDKRPHKCEICENIFKRSSDLKCHSGKKLHKCNICEKSFVSTSNLNVHKLIHKGIKPHKCEVCEKTFTHISGLRRHKLSHEGKRQYKCETCEKNFIYLSSLRYHELIHHKGNKPQKCEVCEKTFVHLSALKSHKLIHESKRRQHQCKLCEKSFMSPSQLKQHEVVHERQKGKQKLSLLNCYNIIYPSIKLENMQDSSQEKNRQCKPEIC